jgi:hypothetical protein
MKFRKLQKRSEAKYWMNSQVNYVFRTLGRFTNSSYAHPDSKNWINNAADAAQLARNGWKEIPLNEIKHKFDILKNT